MIKFLQSVDSYFIRTIGDEIRHESALTRNDVLTVSSNFLSPEM
jgi:hypothetical protein